MVEEEKVAVVLIFHDESAVEKKKKHDKSGELRKSEPITVREEEPDQTPPEGTIEMID